MIIVKGILIMIGIIAIFTIGGLIVDAIEYNWGGPSGPITWDDWEDCMDAEYHKVCK